MTGLTERQLDWLRNLCQKTAEKRSSTDAAERHTKLASDHLLWQEYDSLQTLASRTTETRASRT